MRSILRAQKTVVEQNAAEGVSPNGVLRNPNRRTGGELLPFVM